MSANTFPVPHEAKFPRDSNNFSSTGPSLKTAPLPLPAFAKSATERYAELRMPSNMSTNFTKSSKTLAPQWLQDLEKNGYAVVKNAIPKDRALSYQQRAFSWLKSFSFDLDIANPST